MDLLPGGKKVDPSPLTFPMPTHVSEQPQILTLERLISARLSTYIGVGVHRVQDYADAVKLIEANRLARDFQVAPQVRDEYHARRFGTSFGVIGLNDRRKLSEDGLNPVSGFRACYAGPGPAHERAD